MLRLASRIAGTTLALLPAVAWGQSAAGPAGSGGLTLDQAVKLALSRNERAKISDLNVMVAEAAQEKALTAFLPVLTATGTDQQTAYPPAHTNNNSATTAITVNQPLLSAPAFPLYAQARKLAYAQRAQNVDDRRLLGFAAASAFFAVLNAQDIVQAARHQFDNAKANLDTTRARTESQLSSSNDLTKAQVDMANAAHEVESDKGAFDAALVQLALTINAPAPPALVPPAPTLSAAEAPLGAVDGLVRIAVDRRPDVVVAVHQAGAAHDFASEPMLRLLPTLGLQGQASGTTNAGITGRWNQETLTTTLTWTLYDAGVRYADKHSRDAQASIADLNLQYLMRTVDAQVRNASALLVAAQAAFHASTDGVKFATQNVEETAILYRQGLSTALELVIANDSRFTAEVNYASAEFTMAQAYLGLRQALGLEALGTELR
jgi:outer membrane protein TolC